MKEEGHSLGELYDRHIDEAVRLAYLLTGDEPLAQDLAHDAFLRLFTRFRDLRSRDAFGTYLRRTIVNLARDHHRRRVLQRRYHSANPLQQTSVEQPDVTTRAEQWRALQELPPRHKTALVLRYYDDLDEAGVGELLGCSAAAAKSLIARALANLRRIVREMELS